jgi:hypothetical protein
MKMIKQFISIFAFAAVAMTHADVAEKYVAPTKQNHPSHEHRGFYFSTSAGISYLSSEANSYNFSCPSGTGRTRADGRYEYLQYCGENNRLDNFDAFGFPLFDIRFGGAIGNLVAVYTSFNIGLFNGDGRLRKQDYDVKRFIVDDVWDRDDKTLVGGMDQKYDVYGFYVSLGLGFTVYPFRDPASPLNGFYAGIIGGIDASLARLDAYADDFCGLMGIFTRYEIGKDWWVSDTWSVGVGFSLTKSVYENVNEGDDSDHYVIGLFFRLTRG